MKKFGIMLSVCALVGAIWSGVSYAATTIRVGHVLNPDHPWNVALVGLAEELEKATEGRVLLKIFHSSQLGNEKDLIEGLTMGTIDGSLVGGSSFQSLDPKFGIEELPYAFATNAQAYKAFDGKLGELLFGILNEKGIVGLSWWENGFRHISNNKRPVEKPSDLEGIKIRVTPQKMRLDTFTALGASPMPIPFGELYSALQQGVVDAQENPLSIFVSNAFGEVQKHLSLTGHIWTSAVLCVNADVWAKLSDADKSAFRALSAKWRDEERKMIRDADASLVETIRKAGVDVREIDKSAFREAVQSVWKSFEPDFGSELMRLVREAGQD
ncbi:C4-dicarboxylate ABC transporter substrate-binding protein [Synergistales bacterium]|nr:C4-dicarboxylate ABC transporter substrate-binding protein [Synergistales bacterium]